MPALPPLPSQTLHESCPYLARASLRLLNDCLALPQIALVVLRLRSVPQGRRRRAAGRAAPASRRERRARARLAGAGALDHCARAPAARVAASSARAPNARRARAEPRVRQRAAAREASRTALLTRAHRTVPPYHTIQLVNCVCVCVCVWDIQTDSVRESARYEEEAVALVAMRGTPRLLPREPAPEPPEPQPQHNLQVSLFALVNATFLSRAQADSRAGALRSDALHSRHAQSVVPYRTVLVAGAAYSAADVRVQCSTEIHSCFLYCTSRVCTSVPLHPVLDA